MNWLQRKRTADVLLTPPNQQAMLDNAPVGSVGAPDGLLGMAQSQQRPNYLRGLLGGASFLPGVGDAAGLANDAYMYATEPGSRTKLNYLLTTLGALPMIPNAATIAPVAGKFFRGGKAPMDGQFFSRSMEYAKGFAKGHFGKYDVNAPRALHFGSVVTPKQAEPIIAAMRRAGDTKAAAEIETAIREDGGVLGEHLYMWIENLGKAAPESYLKEAGINGIDTGRDVRLFDPPSAARLSKN